MNLKTTTYSVFALFVDERGEILERHDALSCCTVRQKRATVQPHLQEDHGQMSAKTKTKVTVPDGVSEKALVLRTSDKNRQSYGGFQWPESGVVKCPDFKPTAECGNGLHGLLDGLGDYALLSIGAGETVQVVEVDRGACIEISGKVKFPLCEIKFSGSWAGALKLIIPAIQRAVAKNPQTAATSGYNAPAATSGHYAPAATSGHYAPAATSGYKAPAATSGDKAPAATSGYKAPAATSGYNAPAATSGHYAPAATSGDNAPAATSGYKAPAATSGHYAPASSAFGGSAMAGEDGAIMLAAYGDFNGKHYPLLAVFAGMIGRTYGAVTLKPNTPYILSADGVPYEVAQ